MSGRNRLVLTIGVAMIVIGLLVGLVGGEVYSEKCRREALDEIALHGGDTSAKVLAEKTADAMQGTLCFWALGAVIIVVGITTIIVTVVRRRSRSKPSDTESEAASGGYGG
jgi:hypothetical protein